MTIAQKCRNPLNIRFNPANRWQGSRGSYKGFVVFNSTKFGYRAALILLRNYIRNGYNTPRKIISRWAPPSENNTDSYVKTVCDAIGCQEDSPIVGTVGMCMLCRAMAVVESGATSATDLYLYDLCNEYRIFVELNKVNYGKREKVNLD